MTDINLKWSWVHTSTILGLRVLCDGLLRSVVVFDYALSQWLDVTMTQFTYVIVGYYLGVISSTFLAIINEKVADNSLQIYHFYRTMSGITSILFSLPFLITSMAQFNITFLLIYLGISWFFCSTSFAIGDFVEINIATQYNDASKHGQIVSLLSASWTITCFLYFVQGYIIEHEPGAMYLGLGLFICILPTIIVKTCFPFSKPSSIKNGDGLNSMLLNDIDAAKQDSKNSILLLEPENHFLLRPSWLMANSQCGLIFLSIFIMGVSSGSSDFIVNPIFMDIYGLSSHESGYASLSMGVGELMASVLLMKYSDKWGNYIIVTISTIIKIIVSILLLIMCIFSNNNDIIDFDGMNLTLIDNSLYYFIGLVGLWYCSWELFWVAQLISIAKYVKTHENTSERILLLTVGMCSYSGRIIGALITTLFWDNNSDNHTISVAYSCMLWLAITFVGTIIYFVVYIRDSDRVNVIKSANIGSGDNDDMTQDDNFSKL